MTRSILLQDIAAGAHLSGAEFGATIRPERVALEGMRIAGHLPSGLRLHTLDATAATDFETRILRAPGVVLHLILAGSAEAFIGPHRLRLERRAAEPVRLAFYALGAAAPFLRRARAGDHLRKVSIDIGWDWLAARGIPPERVLAEAAFRHETWPATEAETAMAEELVALDRAGTDPGSLLLREARVFGLVAGLMTRLTAAPGALRPAETERLRRLEDRALRPGPMPDLARIAEEAGMSLSSLQRLFQRAYGLSAKARIRGLRMGRAEAALRGGASVREAAHLAGFVSVESFATAFRRQFGLPPSALGR
ncbi:helix-turn-helix transcriptional regulator [Rhodobacter capsulatus]|uniref:Helix-turn-helix transcriptional regulator n=1 Tax=Rhodobacter capsulatus TaxID=1061 RepID=A0A4U1K2I6_RHOCA|nr:helix-turn-helix transcriptional regulator [Rhodobacter capsulatus]TKD26238.1 helix-turn-helix transcriptional regulator [Rhodobacter capsulatus]